MRDHAASKRNVFAMESTEGQTSADEPATLEAETAITSRPLIVYNIPQTSLWGIKFQGGGFTPLPLQGAYTNPANAQKAIDKYLALKE